MPVSETSERVAKESPSSTKSTAGFTVPSTKEIIITIDGPAGTGKSTVARMLAQRLGLDFLDTGAMYRAAAAIMIDRGYTEDEVGELVSAVIGADLHFDWSQDPPTILAWDNPIDHRIRSDDVTQRVSFVATIPELRSHMVRKQRVIFAQHPRLVPGRAGEVLPGCGSQGPGRAPHRPAGSEWRCER